MKAFTKLIKENPERLNPYHVISIAEIINNNLNYFDKGFRKVNVEVRGAPFFPSDAINICPEMYSLFDCYYNVWNILLTYEREARFHIKYIHIHPFEDGNGRTGRILTNYNLCKNNKAPIIIDSRERSRYFKYINENDVDSLTLLLEKKSKDELDVMLELYETICGNEIETYDKLENDEDIRIYKLARDRKNKTEDI